MGTEVEVFLLRNYATVQRLAEAKAELDESMWDRLVKPLGEIVHRKTDGGGYNGFLDQEEPHYAYYRTNWLFQVGHGPSDDRAIFFGGFFGQDEDNKTATLAEGLGHGDRPTYTVATALALGRYLNDLNEARELWDEHVGCELERQGWEPFGRRRKSPHWFWGHRKASVIHAERLADALVTGDYSQVFDSFERALDDFLAVADKIDRVVEIARERVAARVPATA